MRRDREAGIVTAIIVFVAFMIAAASGQDATKPVKTDKPDLGDAVKRIYNLAKNNDSGSTLKRITIMPGDSGTLVFVIEYDDGMALATATSDPKRDQLVQVDKSVTQVVYDASYRCK